MPLTTGATTATRPIAGVTVIATKSDKKRPPPATEVIHDPTATTTNHHGDHHPSNDTSTSKRHKATIEATTTATTTTHSTRHKDFGTKPEPDRHPFKWYAESMATAAATAKASSSSSSSSLCKQTVTTACRSWILEFASKPCYSRRNQGWTTCNCLSQIFEGAPQNNTPSATGAGTTTTGTTTIPVNHSPSQTALTERDGNHGSGAVSTVTERERETETRDSMEELQQQQQQRPHVERTVELMVHFVQLEKSVRQTILKEWIRSALVVVPAMLLEQQGKEVKLFANTARKRRFFPLPSCPTHVRFCKHAMSFFFDIGDQQWTRLEAASTNQNYLPGPLVHGLCNRRSNRALQSSVVKYSQGLKTFFDDLISQSKLRLDNEDESKEQEQQKGVGDGKEKDGNMYYLPKEYKSRRHVYKTFCWQRGWLAICKNNGAYPKVSDMEQRPDNKTDPLPICSWASFRNYWTSEYSHLDISSDPIWWRKKDGGAGIPQQKKNKPRLSTTSIVNHKEDNDDNNKSVASI